MPPFFISGVHYLIKKITCKLTGNFDKPVRAHIIPKSFYFIDNTLKEPLKIISSKQDSYVQKSRLGVYDKTILTDKGESFFKSCDDYAFKLLTGTLCKAAPIVDRDEVIGYRYDEYNYTELKLFFLSVLWRASVSSQPMFESVRLGVHEDALKRAILEKNVGDVDFYPVVLALFDDVSYPTIANPFRERFGPINFNRLYVGNYISYVKTDRRKDNPFKDVCIAPKKPLTVLCRKYLDSKDYNMAKKVAIEKLT